MSAIASHLTNPRTLPRKLRPHPLSGRIRQVLALWMTRARVRQQWMQFDERDLRDMRISRWDVEREMAKHFWQE